MKMAVSADAAWTTKSSDEAELCGPQKMIEVNRSNRKVLYYVSQFVLQLELHGITWNYHP